ncbi:CCA tRNA nucleotidyltransferase [Candidatus Anaplasma sp. TIGMIC]|nr:CCA tRNA nucleotidyltransferase [Candidatus Anaplasma sp. TIGMIC]
MVEKLICNPGVKRIIKALEAFGGSARLVGGCVRDSLISRSTTDIDLATDLVPDQVSTALKAANIKAIPTGIKHGTITAITAGIPYEITTLRRDSECDGRHALVVFTDDWKEDASRRDFTFNALYCDKHGKVYDYFTGISDLQNRQVVFIGDAEQRVNEDFLRILRVFRFHASICSDSVLSPTVTNVCTKYASKLASLSKERIRCEFFKLLACSSCAPTLAVMQDCGVLSQILPYDVNLEPLKSPHLVGRSPIAKFAVMLKAHSLIQDPDIFTKHISSLFRLSKKEKKLLEILLYTSPNLPLSSVQQQKYMNALGTELYKDLVIMSFITNDKLPESVLLSHLESAVMFKPSYMPVSGSDLTKLGYKEGRLLGQVLKALRDTWEQDPQNVTKAQLLVMAKSMLDGRDSDITN